MDEELEGIHGYPMSSMYSEEIEGSDMNGQARKGAPRSVQMPGMPAEGSLLLSKLYFRLIADYGPSSL